MDIRLEALFEGLRQHETFWKGLAMEKQFTHQELALIQDTLDREIYRTANSDELANRKAQLKELRNRIQMKLSVS